MMHNRVALLVPVLVLLSLVAQTAFCQEEAGEAKTDTIQNKYVPTGLRFGTDLISLVKTRTQDDFRGWEVNGEVDFYRYYVAVDCGTWARSFQADSAAYSNTGDYWRMGVDVNFLTNDPDRNVFFVGGRYGRSVFQEYMSVAHYDPVWGYLTDDFSHDGVKARWFELTTGLRVRIWKLLWIGYTARFKFGLSTDASEEMLPHDVPGFGKTNKETTWGFNYYLMVRLPLRKAPVPPAEK